ncbi:DEKNAAC101331 [Brettanomyces naardenensis]|uniref:DNA polymerase n=1 Tax=Brettanomyces naardenensis TaxID=13370 RepID=A0A448YHL3_BRENA|nr:DEKNAAC101331 [Brettanomyces naardenensis]
MGKRDKFARLKAARAGKKIEQEEDDVDQVDIYDEVDEMEYRKHKRDQLLNDDFIVDENGEGYAETGADDWDGPQEGDEDEQEEEENDDIDISGPRRKIKKVKKSKKGQISSFFKPASEMASEKKNVDTSNLDDILSDFTSTASRKVTRDSIFGSTRKRDVFSSVKTERSGKFSSPHVKPLNMKRMMDSDADELKSKKVRLRSENDDLYPSIDADDFVDARSSPTKTSTIESLDVLLDDTQPISKETVEEVKEEVESEVDDDDDDDDDIVVARKRTTAFVDRSVNLSSSKSKAKDLNSSPYKDSLNSSTVASSSPSRFSDSSFDRLGESDVLIRDGEGTDTVQMYWMDYAEVEGSLLLFGKVKAADGSLVSGVVQINGINREIYFLPRASRRVEDDDGDDDNETENVTAMDVYDEIVPLLMDKYGLSSIKAKPETKKYAFEIPGIPREAEYLKLLLPYQTKKSKNTVIPADLEGETFSHAFSANASIFESFVLQRNIMGPCWLEIKDVDFASLRNATHCNVEMAVSSPLLIAPSDSKASPPDLNVLTVNVQSFMNLKSGKQEVGSVSLAFFKDLPQDSPVDPNLAPTDATTLVRPVGGSLALPPGLKQLASKKGMVIRTFNNERALLNCLAAVVKKADPDVLLGHKLENVTLDILMHRMYDLKVGTWSHFGRINRKQFPDKFGRHSGRNNIFYLREIMQGRLICDIANELGQSLTPKCQSWELSEMYELYCKQKYSPMEVNLSNPIFSDDAVRLLAAFNENRMAVKMISEVAFDIQILSLSKQLTNLAGNAWSHTLEGTRSGRNEYILLHEFTRNNYIVPDKETRQQRQQRLVQHGEEDPNIAGRKSKYQGGLVFEPAKGLVKNYVTVMDFNSLYPSIIQEFNICFTTVDRSNIHEDELPKVPPADVPRGVLPKLLHDLVSRRREVKKLLKDPRISSMEKTQYDIKQRALKLTANSMYGCLGYVNSRFYAKPLAMLVTNRGREILMDTRQLAEGLALRVVYGDTDSVMIDTGCDSIKDALKIAADFKLRVNERYKLLEIDIDNVFKKMLLHAKKKYAAVSCILTPEGKEITSLEVKGLDMKRREFCPLSKDVSTFILNQLLGDNEPEQALTEIYNYLEGVTGKLKGNEVSMVKLKINTRLSKDPMQYPGGKTMPAVQVALRLREQGKIVKAGSVITFVITNDDIENGASVAERARAIQEVLSKTSSYQPDADFYLEKQLFAPISRLLEKVEGYDVVRLASALGLDSKRYEARARSLQNEDDLQPLESTISDTERFRDAKDLILNCPTCDSKIKFGGIQSSKEYHTTFTGVKCSVCDTAIPTLSISAQLEHFIRHQISFYYAGWLVCSDCGLHTRQVSVYGRRCIGQQGTAHSCKGVMKYCYTDKQLYNQLLYLQSVFDVDKAKKRSLKPLYDLAITDKENVPSQLNQGELDALVEQNRQPFSIFEGVVNKYLDDCGRRYVDMGTIFGFLKP